MIYATSKTDLPLLGPVFKATTSGSFLYSPATNCQGNPRVGLTGGHGGDESRSVQEVRAGFRRRTVRGQGRHQAPEGPIRIAGCMPLGEEGIADGRHRYTAGAGRKGRGTAAGVLWT